MLKGTYAAKDWTKIGDRIRSFRDLQSKRAKIQKNIFVPNRISHLISAGLDYAMATNSICLIVGESRLGKTESGKDWKERNNHGRTVMIEVPPIGGPKAVLLELAKAVGVNRNTSVPVMLSAVVRAFNENRMIIVDEVHRCLSSSRTATPIALEVIRYVRDRSGCAVGLLATHRFTSGLSASTYQYEQLVGRIGMPILLPNTIEAADVLPILQQFIAQPGPKLIDQMLAIANGVGRLGVMVETLKLASKLAADAQEPLHDTHVMKSLAMRRAMEARELLEGGRK